MNESKSLFRLNSSTATRTKLVFFVAIICASLSLPAQTPAFPGALGFGAYATGGRNGTVHHVTTLADSGQGSFRDAVSHSGRIVVFDVGGYISLLSAVSVQGNITIAGQTAPGGGIGFKGGEISFANRSNIICRYIRVRPGSDTASTTDDALSLYRARNVILDHCSFEFGPWNNVDAVSDDWQNHPVTSVTFQNCLNADPIYQQFGAHTESVSSTMSWLYCLFANSHNRNPLSKINDVFINNLDYNCSAGYTTHTSTSFSHDIVNNYFITGPATGGSSSFPWYQVDKNQSIYYSGNLFDSDRNSTLNGSLTIPYWYQGVGTVLNSPWSSITATVPTYSPPTAYRIVVSRAGALPRDPIDDLVISQVKTLGNGPTGTGAGTAGPDSGLYTSQTQTGLGNNGYGVINGGVPAPDSDGDGMPDYWEKAVGLNYLDGNDAMTIGPDGYANIERYLNWLGAPHALTVTNTPVDVDLWQYTSGFTNASPIYSVNSNSASNGIVSLTSSHTVQFTPNTNFFGLASFQFSVVTADSSYTETVNVLVTPQTTSSGGANLTWVGDGVSNLWTAGSGTNWFDGTNLVAFNNDDTVTFDDTGSATPPVQLSGSLGPAAIYVVANNQDYTFAGNGWVAGVGTLFKSGAGNLFLNTTNTLSGGVKIDEGRVQLGDGVSANGSLAGSVTNNDTLIYDNPGDIANAINLRGSGVLIKNGPGALTLIGTQAYTNTTTINSGTLEFSGTIPPSDITDNGSLTLAPSGSAVYGNTISGSGAVSADAAGVLVLNGANTFAGDLTSSGSFLVLSNNAAAGAGTIVFNGGPVVVGAGMVISNNFSISGSFANDLCMMATNTGTAVWAGDVTVGGSAQWRPGSDGGTLVFTGNAIQGSHIFIVPRGSVEFASNAVVSSTVSGFLGRDLSNSHRSARITIRDNAAVSMAGCSMGGGKAGSYITITLQDNGSLSYGANTLDVQDINNSAALSTIRLNGGTLTAGGFIKSKTSYPNVIDFNGGILKAGANNPAFLPDFGSASTNVVQAGGAIIDDGGFAVTIAAQLIHDPALGFPAQGGLSDGGLTKLGVGTLTLTAGEGYTGSTKILAGRLAVAGNTKAFANTSDIFVATDAQFDVTGISGGLATLVNHQQISGDGTVIGDFLINSGATLAPGSNSVGTLTFSNSLTLLTGSTTLIAVQPSPPTNAAVFCNGTLTEGGTLTVTNLGGAFAAGDRFQLFSAGTFAGGFSNFVLPQLTGNLAWNTSRLNLDGSLWVVSTVPPAITQAMMDGTNFVANGTGGTPDWYYDVLATTNLALPTAQWMPLATNQFDANGNFILTNAINPDWPQTFYRLEQH